MNKLCVYLLSGLMPFVVNLRQAVSMMSFSVYIIIVEIVSSKCQNWEVGGR